MLDTKEHLPGARRARRIRVPSASAVWALSLLMAACVRHLPVVGEEDGAASAHAGGAAHSGSAGIGAQRASRAENAQRAAAAGSKDEDAAEASQAATPTTGGAGSKAAAAPAGAQRAGANAAGAAKAGTDAPANPAAAVGGSPAPSTPSGMSAPSGASSGAGWFCAQASSACSCVESPAAPADMCNKPHPTCCFEVANGTANRTCLCVPEGSQECTAYMMTTLQDFKKIASCPP